MTPALLPSVVMLPISPTIEIGHLRIALGGLSRQLLSLWRRKYRFPESWQEGRTTWLTSTDAVSDWLRSQAVTVRRL